MHIESHQYGVTHKADHMPKACLVDGAHYRGRCRNATIARWDASRNQFVHRRHKFGETFFESIRAPEDEANYDVFYAYERIDPSEEDLIPDRALLQV